MRKLEWLSGIVTALVFAVGGTGLLAQDQPASGMRAARLSFVQGRVQVLNADNTQLDDAQANLPLIEGQRIATGEDGQAEVELEDGSVARITPQSSITLTRMNSDQGRFLTQISLDQGMAYFELRVAGDNGYYVMAAGSGITPVENASFRVSLDQPPLEVAVLQGNVHLEREGGYSTNVRTGEQFEGDSGDASRYFLSKSTRQDSWDNWNEEREQAAASEAAQRTQARDDYAQDSGYGWSDLDANGNWYDLPGQGRVWQPPVAVDASWDPYGYGNWVWYPGSGYVWVSGYNWGWTPFYCGSWSYWDNFGWGWRPAGGCSRWGWGYGPTMTWRVNVVNPPRVWRPVQRPIPGPGGPGGVHPVIPVRRGPAPVRPIGRPQPRPVMFAGKEIQPLRPVGGAYTPRGGSAVGSSLQKDFPLRNRQPVMGTVRAPQDGNSRPMRPVGGNQGAGRPSNNEGNNGVTPTPLPMPSPGQTTVTPGGWRAVSPARNDQQPAPAQPVNKPAQPGNSNPQRPSQGQQPQPGHNNPPPAQQQPRPQPQPRPSAPAQWKPVQPSPQPRQSAPPPAPAPRPSPPPMARPAPQPKQ